MVASRDYEDLFVLLNAGKVKYLIVGAHALAFHGAPGYAGYLDIFIQAEPRNAARLLTVLGKFGFAGLALTVDDRGNPACGVDMERPPSHTSPGRT